MRYHSREKEMRRYEEVRKIASTSRTNKTLLHTGSSKQMPAVATSKIIEGIQDFDIVCFPFQASINPAPITNHCILIPLEYHLSHRSFSFYSHSTRHLGFVACVDSMAPNTQHSVEDILFARKEAYKIV